MQTQLSMTPFCVIVPPCVISGIVLCPCITSAKVCPDNMGYLHTTARHDRSAGSRGVPASQYLGVSGNGHRNARTGHAPFPVQLLYVTASAPCALFSCFLVNVWPGKSTLNL